MLKGWGLHPLNELASLAEVLGQFASGDMEGSSANFTLPEDLRDQPYERFLDRPICEGWRGARLGWFVDDSIKVTH